MAGPLRKQVGLGKRLKSVLPAPVFDLFRRAYNSLLALVPFGIKYAVGEALRRRKAPYQYLRDGDHVIQVGAPRDILKAGRSRAVYFSRLVGSGLVLVIEPDPANCAELRNVIERHHLRNVLVVESGAWSKRDRLTFLVNPSHPASNVLATVVDQKSAGAHETVVEVDRIDVIAPAHGVTAPRLVSVTTNGAERQILAGMSGLINSGHPAYVSLARTRTGYVEAMEHLGYTCVARDDRGFCFQKQDALV